MTTLKLDMDDYVRSEFEDILTLLMDLEIIQPTEIRFYHTKKGNHIELEIVDGGMNHTVIIAIQSILGSDRYREAFNLHRVLEGNTQNWNRLFHRKNQFARYIDFRETEVLKETIRRNLE